jgi:hypothetical protein
MTEKHTGPQFPTLTKKEDLYVFLKNMQAVASTKDLFHCLSPEGQPANAPNHIQNRRQGEDPNSLAELDGHYYRMPTGAIDDYKFFPGTTHQNRKLIGYFQAYISPEIRQDLNDSISCAKTFLEDVENTLNEHTVERPKKLYQLMMSYKMKPTQTITEYLAGFATLKTEALQLKRHYPKLAEVCEPDFYVNHLLENADSAFASIIYNLPADTVNNWAQLKTTLLRIEERLGYKPAKPETSAPQGEQALFGSSKPASRPDEQAGRQPRKPEGQWGSGSGRGRGQRFGGRGRGGVSFKSISRSHQNLPRTFGRFGIQSTVSGAGSRWPPRTGCSHCGKTGHDAETCFSRPGNWNPYLNAFNPPVQAPQQLIGYQNQQSAPGNWNYNPPAQAPHGFQAQANLSGNWNPQNGYNLQGQVPPPPAGFQNQANLSAPATQMIQQQVQQFLQNLGFDANHSGADF